MKYITFGILLVYLLYSCNEKEVIYNNSFEVKFKNNRVKLKISSFNEDSKIESTYLEITKSKVFNQKLKDSVEIPISIENKIIPNRDITIFNSIYLDTNQTINGEIYSSGGLFICVAGYKCKLYKNNHTNIITDNDINSFNNYQIISLELNPKITIAGQYQEIYLKTDINYDKTGRIIESISFKNIKSKYNLNLGIKFKIRKYYLPNSDSNQFINLKIDEEN